MELMALLDRLEAVNRVVDAVNAQTDAWVKVVEAVGEARDLGATWQQIGDALGIARQTAYKNFARHLTNQERT
jgi:hypothetical protein